MAFNFNWSPLAADTSFYSRAQELLTAALNKSPKPPIIVDDILVHELNLGSVPPDLEILEVGDLAEDRFRGIFKMRYSGDAFLTLKTRVQANPLNTYLSTRPSFASPEPLAADSGLTIPLKITLSNIRLSAFIILVFSKQKGLTLVFRNDPLESLKVSSTFDSISFVRDYLQKEIEGQLRTLLMDEVPAIIYRLSLRLWVPEYREKEDEELAKAESEEEEAVVDPLASPPQDPVDRHGNVLDSAQISALSLDSGADTASLFSQKNLLHLAALSDSSRTLSLFSPSMRDVVVRAWATPLERGDIPGIHSPIRGLMSRKNSQLSSTSPTGYALSESGSFWSKPGGTLTNTSFGGSQFGRHSKPVKKRKHRIVNLRKPKFHPDDSASVSGESVMSAGHSSASDSGGAGRPQSVPEEREMELITPPPSPPRPLRDIKPRPSATTEDIDFERTERKIIDEVTPRPLQHQKVDADRTPVAPPKMKALFEPGPSNGNLSEGEDVAGPSAPAPEDLLASDILGSSTATLRPRPVRYFPTWQQPAERPSRKPSRNTSRATSPNKHHHHHSSNHTLNSPNLLLQQLQMQQQSAYPQSQYAPGFGYPQQQQPQQQHLAAPFPFASDPSSAQSGNSGGILEQAWMMKMAGEIARRVQEQQAQQQQQQGIGAGSSKMFEATSERGRTPPPAYAQ